MNMMMSSETPVAGSPKKSSVQSAEMFIAVVLFAVCAAAGLGAWVLSLSSAQDKQSSSVETVQVFASMADAELEEEEQEVLATWQRRLERAFSQREQALRQQEQSAVLEEQSLALAQAQAAAEAAKEAALAAERRARAAEQARKKALAAQKAAAPPAPKLAAKPKPKANAERIPASVDWSSCRKPRYPRASIRLKQEGTVTMAFNIDAQGQVVDGSVEQSSGHERLDNAALEAIMRCSFTPETLGGEPQPAVAQVRFGWRLGG